MLKTIGKRVPPGDRWEIEETSEIFSSLTDALNYIYLKFKVTQFTMDAAAGTIEIDDGTEAPPEPPKAWDLYGEK
jgi:hypothetical protein|tara:strand:+ start:2068 stop:2292 length:225 start_codon:yes stop_codon:yes gene_type:complete